MIVKQRSKPTVNGAGVARTGLVIALFAITCSAFAAERLEAPAITTRDVAARDYVDQQLREVRREAEQRYPTREEFTAIIEKLRADIRKLEISEATIAGKASQESANVALGIAVFSLLTGGIGVMFEFMRRRRENGSDRIRFGK